MYMEDEANYAAPYKSRLPSQGHLCETKFFVTGRIWAHSMRNSQAEKRKGPRICGTGGTLINTWKETFIKTFPNLVVPGDNQDVLDASALTRFQRLHNLALPSGGLRVRPHTTDDIAAVVRLAGTMNVSVIARGGGSGVVQGIFPDERSVILDLSGLNAIGTLDQENGHIEAEAGANAEKLEAQLATHGFTLGHWPQSMALATVGGLVATKSIGQYSSRYGGIEDMVRGLYLVTGTGDTLHIGAPAPRRSVGPELLPLVIGSEGTLGVITRVRLKVWPTPAAEKGLTIMLPGFSEGLQVMRRWMQSGLCPSVVRLYDPAEAGRTFSSVRGQAVLIAVFHGPGTVVEASVAEAAALADFLGTPGDSAMIQRWFDTRNDVSAWVPLLRQGFLVDTIEVAGYWRVLPALYRAIVSRVSTIPQLVGITGHASHAYPDGANLYFTFMAKPPTPSDGPALYRQIWTAVMEETLAQGGSVSHHHGVGRLRTHWVAEERGPEFEWARQIRQLFDPHGIMNRGVLWPT